jgi:hypothetical protein
MAAYTMASAQAAVVAKTSGFGDNTWVEAYACTDKDGNIGVRVLRYANVTVGSSAESAMSTPGAWDFLTDDAAV